MVSSPGSSPFDGTPATVLGELGGGLAPLELALDRGAAMACAEGLGIMRSLLDMSVEYLKTRKQFGVPIGAFQVLQHRAVDMYTEVELATSMAIAAAIEAEDPSESVRRRSVSAAKVQLAEGGWFVASEAIQLHGGIGCADELDVGLYFKRMRTLHALFGDAEYHLARHGQAE